MRYSFVMDRSPRSLVHILVGGVWLAGLMGCPGPSGLKPLPKGPPPEYEKPRSYDPEGKNIDGTPPPMTSGDPIDDPPPAPALPEEDDLPPPPATPPSTEAPAPADPEVKPPGDGPQPMPEEAPEAPPPAQPEK
jgi:hypothetical protein